MEELLPSVSELMRELIACDFLAWCCCGGEFFWGSVV